jgi:hypothetical protein
MVRCRSRLGSVTFNDSASERAAVPAFIDGRNVECPPTKEE